MNRRWDAETIRRWLGIAGAVAVIAVPIALIAATWEPLEPLPRPTRPALVNADATPERTREERPNRRRNRDRDQDVPPAAATPVSAPTMSSAARNSCHSEERGISAFLNWAVLTCRDSSLRSE